MPYTIKVTTYIFPHSWKCASQTLPNMLAFRARFCLITDW